MDALVPYYIIGLIILYIIVSIIFLKLEERKWNHGVCPECGKPWRYKSRNKKKERIYMCDNYHFCHIRYSQDNW